MTEQQDPTEMPSPGIQGTLFAEVVSTPVTDLGYQAGTACSVVGITYRQLDYWTRTGLVESSVKDTTGSGSQRLYAFRDVLILKIIKRLLDTGVSLQNIRAAVEYLSDRSAESLVDVTLMSDGASIYECTNANEVIDLVRQGQGVFGIAVGQVWRELAGTLASLPPATPDTVEVVVDELAARRARRIS